MAVLFGLTALALITGAIMIRMEDAELRQRFGEQFDAYRQSRTGHRSAAMVTGATFLVRGRPSDVIRRFA